MSAYTVKTHVFEGPLEVLLSLIEKRKLFINDISLAKVADEYLAYVKNLSEFPIADTANFVLVASTLVLIKSKSLLPSFQLTVEEEADIHTLERRLKIYQRMKEVSVEVRGLFGARLMFAPEPRKSEPVFSPDSRMTIIGVAKAIVEVIENLPKKEFLPKAIVQKVMSLEDMIVHLTERVKTSLRMSFTEFSKGKSGSKVDVIVGFLAMLELVKQGIISVTQEKHFEDIVMETEQIGVPQY